MNKKQRRNLIATLVKSTQAKKRKKVDLELAERDTGYALEPTVHDIDDELGHLHGFRSDVKQTEAEEMFYGDLSLTEDAED